MVCGRNGYMHCGRLVLRSCLTYVSMPKLISSAAAVNPGQALLLGEIMTVFTSSDMVARGNFISLMFFVMSLGILVVYFFMGWSTNTIAQVSAFTVLT